MITTNCANCGKTIYLAENKEEEQDTFFTRYWSYESTGEKRPYCDCKCGLEEYIKNKNIGE